jgi:hypothetical protein
MELFRLVLQEIAACLSEFAGVNPGGTASRVEKKA